MASCDDGGKVIIIYWYKCVLHHKRFAHCIYRLLLLECFLLKEIRKIHLINQLRYNLSKKYVQYRHTIIYLYAF